MARDDKKKKHTFSLLGKRLLKFIGVYDFYWIQKLKKKPQHFTYNMSLSDVSTFIELQIPTITLLNLQCWENLNKSEKGLSSHFNILPHDSIKYSTI